MIGENSNCLSFIGKWLKNETETYQQLVVNFYPYEKSLQLFDLRTKKILLHKTKIEDLLLCDFFIGAKLLIFGKQIDIIDYGDHHTKLKCGSEQCTFSMIHSEALQHIGDILQAISENDLSIRKLKLLKIDENYSWILKNIRSEQPELSYFIDNIPSNSFVAMEVTGNNSYERFKELCGSNDSNGAMTTAPATLRALYGNGIYCPVNASNMESKFVFGNNSVRLCLKSLALFKNSTLCIIKPHAVRQGLSGHIISQILEKGFTISAMKMFRFERANCEEFMEVYKEVVQEFESMVMQMISGDLLAIEISNKYENACSTQQTFRDFCGPICPEVARITRPHTLRAKFGQNKIMNAIHCTDLEEDTNLELEYIFKFLP
ncbi:nucleoside diphosphate kinase 7 isoform X3 [Armigeres subalbatus]|uniref:nucleoside diphosphate kinase 7 isoform X2 n=1 Tax=Armigeres subalbatus TaxID=124917 RepID=UPI002ED681F5